MVISQWISFMYKDIQSKNFEYNNMRSIEKRKQLRELVLVGKRPKIKQHKICIKIKKQPFQLTKPFKKLPLLQYGLYSLSKNQQIEALWDVLKRKINYAVNKLQKPDQHLIKLKRLSLEKKKQKLLLLDLDQTLVHSNAYLIDPEVELFHKKVVFRFNVRPHCRNFLRKMSQIFDVYIFTSGTIQYAQPIVKYLNDGKKYIKGILHRDHCLKTRNGLYIKDLRIIQNYQLKNMVIVDNKVHSFSFQLQNGIPIQQYYDDPTDSILLRLQEFLCELNANENVIQFLSQKLSLRKIIEQHKQEQEDIKESSLDLKKSINKS